MHIYLDHAATTPIDPEVLDSMKPYWTEKFGNPSSVHQFGQDALVAIDRAKSQIANTLHASSEEIFFTSGATESNNLAIQGVIQACWKNWKNNEESKPHIITSSIEHPSVLETVQHLKESGLADVDSIPAGKDGVIDVIKFDALIRENTRLVSVMYVNNELGTIQPIVAIAKQIAEKNKNRKKEERILFHTDAVQAFQFLDCDVEKLGVDLLSLSGHKLYGPKGVGVLYVQEGTPIEPILFGGGQQYGLRSGTLPTPLIVGIGCAMERALKNREKRTEKITALSNYFQKRFSELFSEARLNGSPEHRIPGILHVSFPYGDGERTLMALDLEGVMVSSGSACSSGAISQSHVLSAIGLSEKYQKNSLRICIGKDTTQEELDFALEAMGRVLKKMRK